MRDVIINLTYLIASVLFIIGLKGLGHPRTAVRGNLLGAVGMFLAIVVTLIDRRVVTFEMIIAGVVVGTLIGVILAVKIQMTGMPQLVALFNGFGGGASVLVAGAALIESGALGSGPSSQLTVATAASGLIGTVTFWGSLVAFGKLQEVISGNAIHFPGQKVVNALLAMACLATCVLIVMDPSNMLLYWILVALASVLGVLLVIPIGGADMPVVIALLNSYSGIAAAATGFVLSNNVLIIAGSLVGASGFILSSIMCKAMNRSLANVLLGKFSATGDVMEADEVYAGKVKSTSAEEVARLFDTAQRVVIVPGYGMAVAQAQHAVRDLANLLESRGITVEFAIHPVAGRMPGHMNVLLAEANVEYDKLKAMDEINPTMDIHKARTVIVIKRSLSPGFAGIPNPLFAADNNLMYFGDGKKAVLDLIAAVKEAA